MLARFIAPARLLVSLLCVLLVTGTVGAVTEQAAQAASKPTVTAVSPSTGPTSGGTSVTVTGSGFTGATQVAFGKTAATSYTVQSDTTLTAISPAAAKAGAVDVRVTTPAGTSAATAADKFTYAAPAPPSVTGLSPSSGPISGGTTVTISGTGFTGATQVLFGKTAATSFTVNSATSITAVSPAVTKAGVVDVKVTTSAGTSATGSTDSFTYAAASTPTVTGVTPAGGPTAGGTTVTITGTGFTGATKVVFGKATATFTVNSASSITATSPAASKAGAVDVKVTTPAGTSAVTGADRFTYGATAPAPTVTGVSPASGPTSGGTTVTVTGTGFTGVTQVKFGATSGTGLTVTSATSLTVTSPAHAVGAVDVTVTTSAGTSATSPADQFTYTAPAPTVTGVSPTSGPTNGGTTVTLSGTGFTGATQVLFGTTPGNSLTVTSDTSLTVVSPAHAAGAVDVTVTTATGTSASSTADLFTFVAAVPGVSSVSPVSGPTSGGTTVTVTGTGFTGATQVLFGTTPGTSVAVTSDTSLTVVSPAHAAGTVDVTVTTGNGTSATSSADAFTYVAPPTVTSVTPATGPVSGGTLITVRGTNLTGATQVRFGGTLGTNVTVAPDGTSLTVTAPAHAAGTVDVTVTTAGGTSAVSTADRFVYSTATVDHCGTISSNQTWAAGLTHRVTCTVSVKKGVTLTVAPGAVVKFATGTQLQVLGTLAVAGTATNPAYLTSLNDDIVAGDTALDGATTGSPGDWNGVYASTSTAAVGVDNAVIRYPSTAVEVDNGTVSVTNSTVRFAGGYGIYGNANAGAPVVTGTTVTDTSYDGIYLSAPAGVPTVTANTITRAAGNAITVTSANIDLAKLNTNNGSNNTVNGVVLNGDTQTATSTVTLTGTLVPVLQGGCNAALIVKTGVTLTLGAGSLIKTESCGGLEVDGTLTTTGTTANPVTITSVYDDTIGGDTTNDGTTTTPSTSDGYGIYAPTATSTLNLDHLTLRYAQRGVEADNGTLSVTNSTITQIVSYGIYGNANAGAPVVTGTTVTDTSYDGIYLYAPASVPTVTANTITRAAGNAITVASANIDLAKLNTNNGSNNAVNGVVLNGDTQTATSTVTLTGTLVPVLQGGCNAALIVKTGVTLTLGAGSLIKTESCGGLEVDGTLTTTGTTANPVTITSVYDDTIGGDTTNDGTTTTPSTSDGYGIYAPTATSTLNLDHLTLRYAQRGVEADNGTLSVTNSTITQIVSYGIYGNANAGAPVVTGTTVTDTSYDGIYLYAPASVPTVTANTVTRAAGNAITVASANIDLAKLNTNNGSNNAVNGVVLNGDTQTATSTVTLTGTLVPVLQGGCGYTLTVKNGVTFTLGAGSVIKTYNCAGIEVDGTLTTTGTTTNPVTITSVYDDTVGGDTTNDGTATTPSTSDGYGIYAPNATSTLNLDHLTLSYSYLGVRASNNALTVTNSTIAHVGDNGITADTNTGAPTLTGNAVTDVNGYGIYLNAPASIPTVTGNTITSATNNAIQVNSANIDLAKLNANNGSNNAVNGVVLNTDIQTVTSTVSLTGTLVPVLQGGPGTLTVKAGVTLTLGAGSVVKAYGASLQVNGRLVTTGTTSNKVYLTSLRDDAVGGDTNNDGNATMPAAGDWQGIVLGSSGTTSLTNAVVRYN